MNQKVVRTQVCQEHQTELCVAFALPILIALILLNQKYTEPSAGPIKTNMLQDVLQISAGT